MQSSPTSDFVSTGVAGLDLILGGGFLRAGFYLLQGDPGAGKTTVALQFLREGQRLGASVLYVTLTETYSDLARACESHGWSLEGIQVCDLTATAADTASEYMMFKPSEVEMGETARRILEEVEKRKPTRVVFDGLSELRLLAADALRYRRQLLGLKAFFEQQQITALLLDDRTSPIGQLDPESLVGGNIVLERLLPGYGGARRRIYVTKVRGADFWDGYHDYEICAEGVVVHPRLIAAKHQREFEARQILSGIENLDALLSGGLDYGTTTLLLGPAGAGKSTLAMQYVAAALSGGLKAAVFTFDEVLATLVARSEKLVANGIGQYIQSGALHAKQVDPAELSPGAFAHEVQERVRDGARVVVIDSLNGYLSAMPEERFLTTHLHELFAYLNQNGMVTIVVVAQHGLLMASNSELDVSYLADTVLVFRYFEADAQIRQSVSVFKKRTGVHERALRELRITEQGLRIGPPLRGFRGIMTGVPEYHGTTQPLQSEEK